MKRALQLVLSLVVTVGFGWWAFRDTHWAELWQSLKTADYLWLVPYVAVLLAIHVCRTLRWGFLLAGLERVPFRGLNEAAGIGFMMLLVLPFRLGEFARPFLIAQRSSIRRSAAMTTVVLERIVDGLTIATLLRVLLFFLPPASPELAYVRVGANVMFAVFGGGLMFLLFARWHQARAVRLVQATLGRFAPRLADKAAGMVDTFVGAMRHLPGPRDAVGFFLLTAVYWALNGVGMTVLSHAFKPFSLSLFQSYTVLCVLVVGLMIPSAPGMVGTFQAFVKLGLTLFFPLSMVNVQGIAFANVLWLCQTMQQILLGLALMWVSQFSFKDLTGNLEGQDEASAAT